MQKEEIREDLIKRDYTNKLVNYQEFLELYKPYQKEMSEMEFAEILGISYSNYMNIRHKGTRARVLKVKNRIPKERKKEIIEDLRKKGCYRNKSINYQEFLELYKPYEKEMSEKEFVGIIGISYDSYMYIKNKGQRTKILKEENKIPEKRKEEIREELIKKGCYRNKLIDYQEFLELYKPYEKEMSEKEFAEILGISYGNYISMKNKGTRAKVLKEESKISGERKEKIREDLIKRGYRNKSIDYQEFLELYKPYEKEMSEIEFSKILEISYSNYNHMKNGGRRARVLKEENRIPGERKEEIREDLIKRGYRNKLTDYQEFLELYKPYEKEVSEIEFAEILGISYSNYNHMKNGGRRARVLKEENRIPGERKEEIRENLIKRGYRNKLIDYQEFLELYKPYEKEMSEIEFAEILGISYGNYKNMKNNRTRAKINFSYQKLRRMRYKLSLDSREYKREELEQLCKKYKITLEELLLDIVPDIVVENVMNKENIYIGRCKVPENFLNRHSEELLHMSRELSKKMGKKYKFKSDTEDIASEALIYIIERKGDIVKNHETEEEALEFMRRYMLKVIKYKYIDRCKVRGTLSLDETIDDDGKRTRYEIVKAPPKTETEKNKSKETSDSKKEEIQESEKSAVSIVDDMKMCYENGMKDSDAIAYVRDKYGISRKDLLKILEKELSKKRKIIKSSTGKVYLGEEYER